MKDASMLSYTSRDLVSLAMFFETTRDCPPRSGLNFEIATRLRMTAKNGIAPMSQDDFVGEPDALSKFSGENG